MKDSTFLSQFLLVTDFRTILFIAVLIGLFFATYMMQKKKVKFSLRMIICTLLGLVLGIVIQWVAGFPAKPDQVIWLAEIEKWYGLVGYGFLDLLKMLVVPMIFTSIVRVIMKADGDNLGALTSRTIGILLGTTALAAIVGILVAHFMNLGGDVQVVQSATEMREITPIVDTLRGLLPSNPVKAMAEANVVAVVIFAAFLGIAIKRLSKKYSETIKPFVDLIEAFYKIIVSVAMTVIKFMPYAVIALLANTVAGRGVAALLSVMSFIVAMYISIIIMFIIQLIIVAACGLNPFKYVKNVLEVLIMAFTSRSSLGTLPVTIEKLTQNVGVEEGVASFVGSLGSNMGMNGCAGIYPALMAVTLANMSGTKMDLSFYIMLLVVIAIGSLGIAGLPGTATIAVSVVISGVGLGGYFPLAGGILAIDPILDMGRTMLNVNGTMIAATVVSKSTGALDKEIYNAKK